MFFAGGAWHREGDDTNYTKVHNKTAAKAKATTDHIRALMQEGFSRKEICKHMGLSINAVLAHIKKIENDA